MTIFLLVAACVLASFDTEVHFAATLRDDGFHRLSELQCKRVLSTENLTTRQRVRANIELSKTLTARALNSRQPQRREYWRTASEVLRSATAQSNELSSQVLLELQLGLTKLEQAEWNRREAEIRATRDEQWQGVRSSLRETIRLLKKVEADLVLLNRQRVGRDDVLSADEIAELRRNTRYQLSRAYRNQAISYAARRGDQIGSLTAALKQLQTIASSPVADDITWKARLDRIECYRLRGDLERASLLLTEANQQSPPSSVAGRMAAEGVRLALAARNPQAALEFVQSQKNNQQHPELDLARMEVLVALGNKKASAEAETYRLEAAQIAAQLGRRHGIYWGLRGEMLISRLSDSGTQTEGPSLLDTTARTLLKQNKPDEAIDTFVRAADQAKKNGQLDVAFDFLHKAAIVNHREGQLQPAIDRFRHVAKAYPSHPQASASHLSAIFDAAELYQTFAKSGQEEDARKCVTLYRDLLEEHLQLWPEASTADQARVWFGRLASAQGDWQESISTYQGVTAGSEFAAEAYSRLGDIYLQRYKRSPDKVQQAREWFSQRREEESSPEGTRALSAVLSKLAIYTSPYDYALAEVNLRTAIRSSNATQQRELLPLLVIALAGSGNLREARTELTGLLPLPSASLVSILHGLLPIRDAAPDNEELKAMTVDCLKLLQVYSDPLSDQDKLLIQQTVAETKPGPERLQIYRQLATQHPQDSRIQLRYAELTSMGRDRASRDEALTQWRRIAKQSRPRSRTWFRAKLGVAQTHFDKGEHQTAKEVIELLMTLYPNLGGPDLRSDFEDLLRRIEG